ncbi:helix-turn-helix domain-containing protein [Streptomyces flavotricini]|uniref:Helix-turn-helix domain-containing protein n=1 Tax=Streptomyces flavotricini TaxID=66888 RepID=A0ABS8EHX8_9ACTN|nr:helix-turn-helix transcriptional regulator [Streptomyces flavotricini]MCC0100698.1 helix-turn-helix domain-containing protein [Streptomyces flavotricini]
MLEEQEAIGQRIRRQRLSVGQTQADLAAAVGKTQAWVSRVEKGQIELDRATLINALAAALHCHPNTLIQRPYSSAPGAEPDVGWHAAAASVMRELRRYDLAPVFEGAPRPSAILWQEMCRLHRLRDAAANSAILREVPDLLRESRALAEVTVGREREEAFAVYAVACKFTHTAVHALGQPELVALACERAVWAAQRSGDPLLPAVADWMRVWDMWATADYGDALALADKALAGVQELYDGGDPLALRVWGSLQLRSAVSAARDGNAGETRARMRHAVEAADRVDAHVGPIPFDRHSLTFSMGNVHIHEINVALEMSNQREALRLNRDADPGHIAALPKSRQGHHHMDLARAWLWDGNRSKALTELETAETLAPQLVRNHPIARATLRQLVYAERQLTRQKLRGMSDRFSLDDL